MPPLLVKVLRARFTGRWSEFSAKGNDPEAARDADLYRHLTAELLQVERRALIDLLRAGKVDNTVMRRIQRLLDLEMEEIDLLEATGHADIEGE